MPDDGLRKVWTAAIDPDDYDAHMAVVGQAAANAELVRDLLLGWPPATASILLAGAGTGQFVDYVGTSFLTPYEVTASDLNPRFLERLQAKFEGFGGTLRVVVDDVEQTALAPGFGAVILVLVLEHVDWRRALASLAALAPERWIVVVQRTPPGVPVAGTGAKLPVGTMTAFRQVQPSVVDEHELVGELASIGYALLARRERPVAGGKTMVGLVFGRDPQGSPITRGSLQRW